VEEGNGKTVEVVRPYCEASAEAMVWARTWVHEEKKRVKAKDWTGGSILEETECGTGASPGWLGGRWIGHRLDHVFITYTQAC
jgi:hypothetical protein